MHHLENPALSLDVSDDARRITLTDLRAQTPWHLDAPLSKDQIRPAQISQSQNHIAIRHFIPQGEVLYTWTLHADHAQITLQTDIPAPDGLPLPGSFAPSTSLKQMALPLYQGLLIRTGPADWKQNALHGGHNGFSLTMAALLAQNAGLLITHDSPVNWNARFGQSDHNLFFHFQQLRCPVEGFAHASVRIFPIAPSHTAACKRYRQLLKDRNQFVTWAEKIEQRPIVKKLFGALMAFVGYNKTPDIDYAQGAQALRDFGFESVLYYPLRMCHYSLDFKMGGDDPIWLSDEELAEVHKVDGALIGPWGWTFEALDDGSPSRRALFRHNDKGAVANWRIDQAQWYQVCTPQQIEHIKQRFAGDMKAMDWIHFDVNACVPGSACHQTSHAAHAGRAMSCREDAQWVQKLFAPETVGNRIVCSEGFTDHNAHVYDIGSTKLMPALNPESAAIFIPIPMTMLVFHDSCAHAWWELHNYNELPGMPEGGPPSFALSDLPHHIGSTGSGAPRLKAALDALSGSAPHVFPFGKQYGWRNFAQRESYSFTVRLEDQAVQQALAIALPIAQLHKKIGQLEMTDHQLLTPDGSVQSSQFAGGTQILANLSPTPHTGNWGTLNPYEWRATHV